MRTEFSSGRVRGRAWLVGIGAAALLAWLLPIGLLAPSAAADGAATERVLRPNAAGTTRLAQANPCGARNPCGGK